MQSRFLSFVLPIGTVFILSFSACKHDPLPGPVDNTPIHQGSCDPNTVYFVNDVLPILQSNCAIPGCHDAITHEEGIILNNFTDIINTGKVKPGNANGSKLIKVINETGGDRMPPITWGPGLTADQINTITQWINQGAQNNVCEETNCDTSNVLFSTVVSNLINTSCKGCHSSGYGSGGVLLTNYAQVSAVANDGRLLNVVNGNTKLMPPGNKLSDCKINTLQIWVNNGTPQ